MTAIFWKEELEDKVSDVRNVRRVVEKAAGGGKDRSRSRRRVVERVELTLNGDLMGGTAPLRQDPRFVSRTTGLLMGVPQFAQRIACMCASSAWNHIGQLNAQRTQDGHLQPKMSGRAKARRRPRNDCLGELGQHPNVP